MHTSPLPLTLPAVWLVLAACTAAAPATPPQPGQAFCCASLDPGGPYGRDCSLLAPEQIHECVGRGRAVLQCGEAWAIRPPGAGDERMLATPTTDAMCFVGRRE